MTSDDGKSVVSNMAESIETALGIISAWRNLDSDESTRGRRGAAPRDFSTALEVKAARPNLKLAPPSPSFHSTWCEVRSEHQDVPTALTDQNYAGGVS